MKYIAPALFMFVLTAAMASLGCGSEVSTTSTGTTGSGTGGGGGAGGSGGGGGSMASKGHTATEFVTAGGTSKSPNYKMVHTLGQPTQNQGKTNSSNYRLQGGLNGANGSLP